MYQRSILWKTQGRAQADQTGGDAATRLLFEAERRGAGIQKELHHLDPRMVEIYEYGEIDGYFFVAMHFEGRNLPRF